MVTACAVALPWAVTAAGSAGPGGVVDAMSGTSVAGAERGGPPQRADRPGRDGMPAPDGSPGSAGPPPSAPADDGKPPPPLPGLTVLGEGLSTAVRCGPELSSPDGIEAQTCVVTQGAQTWARTYFRNATGEALDAVLTSMGPHERTVRMTCAVSAQDEPGICETPREPARGGPAAYSAVAEFARRAGQGPLLLRSGSNSRASKGS